MDAIAADRVPWIGALWDTIDLQIALRGGRVTGSLLDDGTLRLRKGDQFRFAVLFFDGTNTAVDPAPTRLRWTLRDAANLEPISVVTLASPAAETDQSQPYFLLSPDIARLGATAADLLPDGETALACVADLDWQIGGHAYSSKTFPVFVEFGLTPQNTSPSAPATPTPPATPPATPTPEPPVPAPQGITEDEARTLFDQLFEAKFRDMFPLGQGFAYVNDGDVTSLVPASDCATGNSWTP